MNFIHQITQSVNSQLSHILENNSHNTMLEQYYTICSMRLCDEYLLTQLQADDSNLLKRIWQIIERDKILQQLAITFHLSKTEIFSLLNEATPILYAHLQQQADEQGIDLYQLLLDNHDDIRRLLPMWVGDIIPQEVLNAQSTSAPTCSKVGQPVKVHSKTQQTKPSQVQQTTATNIDKHNATKPINDNLTGSPAIANNKSPHIDDRSTTKTRSPRSASRVPAYRSANNDNSSKKLLWLVIIVAVVLVLIWGLLWFLVTGNKDKNKDNAQKSEVAVEQSQGSEGNSQDPTKPLEAPMKAKEKVTETEDPTVTNEESSPTAEKPKEQSETVTQQQSQTFVPTNGNQLQQQLGYDNQTAQQPMPQEQAQPQSQPMSQHIPQSQPMSQPMPQSQPMSQPLPQSQPVETFDETQSTTDNNNRSVTSENQPTNTATNTSNVVYYDSQGNPMSGGSARISTPDDSYQNNPKLSRLMDNSLNQPIYSEGQATTPNP